MRMNFLTDISLKAILKKSRFLLLIFVFATLASCKKTTVDATNTKTLQSSINDMASSLTTLQQVKFSEALYIIKTFGVEAEGSYNELQALGKLINGKKVPEIFALADKVAQSNGIDWTSTGPPSLGEMNIFGNESAKESDPNEVSANSLSITINPLANDEVLGVQSLQVVPRLLDNRGQKVNFTGAALEVVLQVFSGGNQVLQAKNLMQDNNFKGFTLRFSSLPSQKIINNQIDITVTVKTTKKTFKMTKVGVDVNPKALRMPPGDPEKNPANPNAQLPTDSIRLNDDTPVDKAVIPAGDPKATVSRFLNNLSTQNLRGAYATADNPAWGSYDQFSNPTSGFGGVKGVNVKNIATTSVNPNSANVNATYDITDKDGKTTSIQVTFGLKNTNGEWKISSYKIN